MKRLDSNGNSKKNSLHLKQGSNRQDLTDDVLSFKCDGTIEILLGVKTCQPSPIRPLS